MKKISLSFLSLVLLMASCQKNQKDLPAANEEETVEAVPARQCASMEILEEQLKTDPQRARNLDELERRTQEFQGRGINLRGAGKLYIPVVVNVVLPNSAQVTNAQIQSQLDALNRDYNKLNPELTNTNVYLAGYSYTNVANCQIEFYIQDWTNDVNRKNAAGSFGTNDAVKKTASGGLSP
ncbi:MAG: zinc metalloprotease, partial [Chitinophagaceae bacterium]